jgi:acyl-CoA thioesterase FadM
VLRDGETLVSASVEVCVLTLDGKPRRIPESMRGKLEAYRA